MINWWFCEPTDEITRIKVFSLIKEKQELTNIMGENLTNIKLLVTSPKVVKLKMPYSECNCNI